MQPFSCQVGLAIPSLMNRTETGGRTVWQTGIQLEAEDASWIGENHRICNLYATSCPQRQVGIALGSICYRLSPHSEQFVNYVFSSKT
jgi:hypothetical protein